MQPPSWVKLNYVVATLAAGVGIYSSIVLVKALPSIHTSFEQFFESSMPFAPELLTFLAALVPVSLFALAYLVYIEKRGAFLFLLLIYPLLLFQSYALLLLAAMFVWWYFYRNEHGSI